jgi:hypothetical protein
MCPQHPDQGEETPTSMISKYGISTSDYFLYVVSNTTATPRWANTEPSLLYAKQAREKGPKIISVKVDDTPLPLILKETLCIDLTQNYERGFKSLLHILHSPTKRANSAQVDQWAAAYYPTSEISNPRLKTIMCLLFEKVILHFPIAHTGCGGGAGISNIVLEDSALVEAGVLQPREELLIPGVEVDFSPGHYWGTPEEFEKFYRLQITAMTMEVCSNDNLVPVADDADWPIPASLLENIDLLRCAPLQASALAIESLEIALPKLADVPDEDILKAREELSDQLIPFRHAMLALSPAIRSGIENGATLLDIQREAKYVVDTQVAPALGELRDKLAREKGRFWRRFLL